MISVIIPTYNEKKNISKIKKKLSNLKIVSEVIFVDDNSPDGTYDEIKKIKSKKIKGYLRVNKIKDLSKSVIMGVEKSNNNYILVMDGDLQHDFKYINKLWKKIYKNNVDIVVASRFLKKRNYLINLGFFRSLASNIAIILINLVFGKKTSDPLSGFFLCKKKMITSYKNFFYSRGYKILFDVLYNGNKSINVLDEEIVFKKRYYEKSKFRLRIIWLFILQMLYTKSIVKK